MARTKNFIDVIKAKLAADADLADAVETEAFNAYVAMQVYEARKAGGLTQGQLAERIDTHQSVISRIEDADYDGHSLKLLKRIARALGKNLRVEFYACPPVPHTAISVTLRADWATAKEWKPTIQGQETEGRKWRNLILPGLAFAGEATDG